METNSSTDAPAREFVLLLNITSAEVLKTALLAAVGAVVSFTVSFVLNRIVKRRKMKQ